MFIVLARPSDNYDIADTYIADHLTKEKDLFELDWELEYEKIMEKPPVPNESMDMQVIKAMKEDGWQIISAAPAKVTY